MRMTETRRLGPIATHHALAISLAYVQQLKIMFGATLFAWGVAGCRPQPDRQTHVRAWPL